MKSGTLATRNQNRNLIAVSLLVAGITALLAGCTPTYRAGTIDQSIVDICKREYDIDVKVATVGKTIAIYLPLENLLDFSFTVTESASDKINDVLLSATRVAISTDAVYDFYCIIAHDVKLPEIQIVIIKSVDDVKRFLLNDISRGDYSKRMLIDLRLSPQAKKEKVVKGIFEKMNLEKEWQEELLNDFFRTEPAGLEEIGYWNGRFFIKDIALSEFIADQIASRVRIAFKEDKSLGERFIAKSVSGKYSKSAERASFVIDCLVVPRNFKEIGTDFSRTVFEIGLGVAATVVHSYRFDDFDYVEIIDTQQKKSLKLKREDAEPYRQKKLKIDDMLVDVKPRQIEVPL